MPSRGAGLVTMVQLVPFHCSIRVAGMPPPFWDCPTAQMSLADTTAAPDRVLNTAVEGLGLGTTAQLAPFHCSIRVPLPLSGGERALSPMGLAETRWLVVLAQASGDTLPESRVRAAIDHLWHSVVHI